MPFCYLPKNRDINELEIIIRRHRLEDIQKRIAVGDFEINDPDLRSPSPDSAYDPSTGQNINPREARAREKYTVEKNFIIEELLRLDNSFIAPADYKPPIKKRRIYLPEEDLQETNYIGLIIGPGGKTQKDLEKRSKCKISIRGKGANVKSRIFNRKDNDHKEPLHVLVESQNEEDLDVGVKLVEELLDPNSDAKKNQLIELAAIRGTLRDYWCEDCGERGHRRFECPNKINSWKKVDLKCEICGQTSHPSRDCPMKRVGYQEAIANNEDDLEEFLNNFKAQKANMIENGDANDDEAKKTNAFEDAAKKVVNVIEKEAPGTVSKEVKDQMKIYQKDEPEEKLNDRVVAVINTDNKVALSGASDPNSANPLSDLNDKFKDSYGKILANQAVNFYDNYVQPRFHQPPPAAYPPAYPQNHQVPYHHYPPNYPNMYMHQNYPPPQYPGYGYPYHHQYVHNPCNYSANHNPHRYQYQHHNYPPQYAPQPPPAQNGAHTTAPVPVPPPAPGAQANINPPPPAPAPPAPNTT